MKRVSVVWLLMLVLIPFAAVADDAPEDESPSLELLEFLADWETDDGEWVDPMRFQGPESQTTAVQADERDED